MICVIPARKGSKRIKNKNTKLFFGKPLISNVILNLKKFKIFKKIIVSTDCIKIKKIAEKLNVDVLLRNKKLADDYTDTRTVVADAIKKLEKNSLSFNKVACVYPTSIFLKKKHLSMAEKKLKKNNSYIFSAKKFEHSIYRSFYKSHNKQIKLNFNINTSARTQDLKDSYHDAGQFYLGWKNSWLYRKKIFDKKSDFILFSALDAYDIDNYEDFKVAKILWKLKLGK